MQSAGAASETSLRVRRKRVWAPTAQATSALGRSAKQLARVSVARLTEPDVVQCLREIRQLRAVERACKLLEGDRLVVLIDEHGLRPIDLARELEDRPSDLCEKYRTAKLFPPGLRPEGVKYNHLLMASRMWRKFPRLRMSPVEVLAEIERTGLSQHRDVGRHFTQLALATSARLALPAPIRRGTGPFNRTYHCRFQDLLRVVPKGAIQILHLDPPYVYDRRTGFDCRSGRTLACDGRDPATAVLLVLDLLSDWLAKLAPGGVALLWQPWGSLRAEYQQAIRTDGWDVFGPVIWDKGRPQPGDLGSPYARQGEMLFVLYRAGDRLLNYDGSSRSSIVRVPIPRRPRRDFERDEHGYEKPVTLLEFLIRKHSREGDLVFDACGCTGSMSVAAINCGRRWVYAESNAANYALGSRRIAAELAKRTANAAAG